ncbi:MAG: exodeoxyribonuclease VII large subunit [Bacteroidales bacterium]|nr:exodeoxyribonuclease VII large subunit [Bacteroidales bacterium]
MNENFKEAISLSQLTGLIRRTIEENISRFYLVIAEIQSITINRSGHAYLELIEKSPLDNNQILSQIRATIWANKFRMIKPYFESVTGSSLKQGLKIMVKAQVSFHELYGLSLNISDILPEYTVGELAMQRKITIEKLKNDGVFEMNREKDLPLLIKRIAVISSSGAAGYGDFCNQLSSNPRGYKFYTRLFEASMQGNTAEESIIKSLENIYNSPEDFDCVVIIRGGGSKTDLNCFDSYILCQNICQFPLPIITGIGHERDESVADLVAHTHLKTPTAVAQFLIDRTLWCENSLNETVSRIKRRLTELLNYNQRKTDELRYRFITNLKNFCPLRLSKLETVKNNIKNNFKINFERRRMNDKMRIQRIGERIQSVITEQKHFLTQIETKIEMNSPKHILKKGYAVMKNSSGEIITGVKSVSKGDEITTVFYDGQIKSKVENIINE